MLHICCLFVSGGLRGGGCARPAGEKKGPAEGYEAGEGTAEGAAGDEIIGTRAIGRARAFGDGG